MPGTPDQAGLRIRSFIGISFLLEPGFGAKSTSDQAGPQVNKNMCRHNVGWPFCRPQGTSLTECVLVVPWFVVPTLGTFLPKCV